jgi:gamma-glutamylcyclotransferase (GGCT)/AIG2-like uncharacterized protein YtfP
MTAAAILDARVELFVYGTLKRGQENHELLCRGATQAEPAVTRGALFDLSAGYPALVVPASLVLATGSADPQADLTLQQEWQQRLESGASSLALDQFAEDNFAEVYGERLVFEEGWARLRRIDRFEGFRPGGRGLYERVLIPVWLASTRRLRAAWTYVQPAPRGTPLPHGAWPP